MSSPYSVVRSQAAPRFVRALEPAEHVVHLVVHVVLKGEAVHADAQPLQRRAHPGQDQVDPPPGQRVHVQLGGAVDLLREPGHVVALVAVLGRLLTAGARPDRLAEAVAPGIPFFFFALHPVPRELEDLYSESQYAP